MKGFCILFLHLNVKETYTMKKMKPSLTIDCALAFSIDVTNHRPGRRPVVDPSG